MGFVQTHADATVETTQVCFSPCAILGCYLDSKCIAYQVTEWQISTLGVWRLCHLVQESREPTI